MIILHATNKPLTHEITPRRTSKFLTIHEHWPSRIRTISQEFVIVGFFLFFHFFLLYDCLLTVNEKLISCLILSIEILEHTVHRDITPTIWTPGWYLDINLLIINLTGLLKQYSLIGNGKTNIVFMETIRLTCQSLTERRLTSGWMVIGKME